MYTAGSPTWSNNPYETRDPRKFISLGLLCFTFVMHIISGATTQAKTNWGGTVNLFSTDDGVDNGFGYYGTFLDCGNSTWLVIATIAFVAATIKLMVCIGLMIMNFVRTFQPHAAVMVLCLFTAMSLTAQPVAILIFKFNAQNCWGTDVSYTLGAGFIIACFVPPLAIACAVPSYMMYRSHQAINQQRALEIQEALVGAGPSSPTATSPMNMPPNQHVMYVQQQPNMMYMTTSGGVVYMQQQQPTVVMYQQPQQQMYQQQQPQPQQQQPMYYSNPQSPMNNQQQPVVMGVEVPQ